jgi:CRP/FNR family cyclic AMP-dependent transcriptional regulator
MAANRKSTRPRLSSKLAVLARKDLPHQFDAAKFLATAGLGRTVVQLQANQPLFSQGDPADTVFYIQKGRVRLAVVSKSGKEATIALLGPGDFVGESCITSEHSVRLTAASTVTACTVLRIGRDEMLRVLHRQHQFSDLFMAFLLARNARIQDDLVDQLFNSSEKRLARILLLLAQFGKPGKAEAVIPKISHQMLAQMIGTTRSRVTFFLNRFRKLGFIEYNGEIQVHNSLLNIILHD